MSDNICTHCKTKLRSFKKTTDWSLRKMHKDCFEQIKSHENLQYFTKLMIQRDHDIKELRFKLFSR
jgi:hypothetical protein